MKQREFSSEEIETEVWRGVPGYEGFYRVSSLGRVYSVERKVIDALGRPIVVKPHLMAIVLAKGYPRVTLSRDGEQKYVQVHSLVLETFVGPRPDNYEACHWDGDRQNCRLSNLRFDTRDANAADRIRHGRQAHGQKHGMVKLTDDEVRQIRELLATGAKQKHIAGGFGVDASLISRINSKELWGWLDLPSEGNC